MKILPLFLCILLNSCVTGKIATKTGVEEIHFGNGGGFTGEIKEYTLTSESKLLQNGKELKKIDSEITFEVFNSAKELKDYQYSNPDNMYSFIELKTKEKTNRIVWSYGSTDIDKKVTELYNKLILTTK